MKITPPEAAKILKYSRAGIYQLMQKGKIPFKQLSNGRYVLKKGDVLKYKKKHDRSR